MKADLLLLLTWHACTLQCKHTCRANWALPSLVAASGELD
jgi:hypothetical protein